MSHKIVPQEPTTVVRRPTVGAFASTLICCLALIAFLGVHPAEAQETSEIGLRPVLVQDVDTGTTAADPAQVAELIEKVREVAERGGPNCGIQQTTCGGSTTTVTSTLNTQDCFVQNGFYAEFWDYNGTGGQTATLRATSGNFVPALALFNPNEDVVAEDNANGADSNARIVYPMQIGGVWTVAVFNAFANDFGGFNLNLTCAGTTPGNPPAAPTNLTATPLSTSEIQLAYDDNSNNENEFRIEIREQGGGNFVDIGAVPANTTLVDVTGLDQATTYEFRVRARNAGGNSAYTNIAAATTDGQPSICVEDNFTLCLNNNRFRVTMDFDTPQDPPARAQALPLASDFSGLFYFRNSDNAEVLIKALNGCPQNNHYWVFYAATTNVEFTIRVTDTDTGQVQTYFNPQRNPAEPVQDTFAFATCP